MEESYKTYEFKTPDEHPFPKGMKILYIPPSMPDFVGPMPQIELTEGKDYTPPNVEWVTNGKYQAQAEASNAGYFREKFRQADLAMEPIWKTHPDCPHGFWPVSTQEVLCCQEMHGGQDKMIEAMAKTEVYFYIHDATLPQPELEIQYRDYQLKVHDLLYGEGDTSLGIRKYLRNDMPVLINAPIHSDRRTLFTEHLLREIRENHNEPIFITCESVEHAVGLFGSVREQLKERGSLILDPVQFNIDRGQLLTDVKEDHFTPRNRRERRQGKQLDSKHKGRGEWWNR